MALCRWRTPLNGFTSPFDTEYSVLTLLGDGTLLIGSGDVQGGLIASIKQGGHSLDIQDTRPRGWFRANVDSKNSIIFETITAFFTN